MGRFILLSDGSDLVVGVMILIVNMPTMEDAKTGIRQGQGCVIYATQMGLGLEGSTVA